jgi:glycosyltransferase involved in cell wall biosynthesis
MHSVMMLLYTLEPAGAEKVVLSLVARLDRRRYSPVVCAFRGGALQESFERLGVPVYVLDKKRGADFRTLWRLVQLMRQHRVKILHSHNFSANLWGRLAAVVARVPVRIATEHSMPSIKTALHRIADRLLAHLTTRIVCVAAAVRDAHVRAERISSDKFMVIYNGIDPWTAPKSDSSALGTSFRKRLGIAADSPLCMTVGRLEPPKGHHTLLDAAPQIVKAVPNVRFVLVGDGSLRADLERQANELGIRESVVFLGARSDVRELLAISNLVIVPSHREGFSIAVLEAMAAGRPIVATAVGGNAEALESGKSGLIVRSNDIESLTSASVRLLTDTIFAQRCGAEARRRFEEYFGLEAMVRSHEALYAQGRRSGGGQELANLSSLGAIQ